jgi:hypothetical protein
MDYMIFAESPRAVLGMPQFYLLRIRLMWPLIGLVVSIMPKNRRQQVFVM